MLKKRARELIVLMVILAVYNILVFVIPFKKTGIFAISYVFAIIAIIAFAACYFIAFDRSKTLKSKFLNIPIFQVGFIYLAAQLFLSTLFMAWASFFAVNSRVAIGSCALLLAIAIVKTITIDIAREKMENIAFKQEINTSFIRSLHVDLDDLASRAATEPLRSSLVKLSEAVRFSDPVSSDALSGIEEKMKAIFDEVSEAVREGQNDVEAQIDELGNLLQQRNKMCKISKPM